MRHLIHRDQIHRDVFFDPISIALLNTPHMQRLGRVYQLGYAHLVYRGGTHTRLSHVMGAAFVAEKIVDSLRNNYEVAIKENNLPFEVVLPDVFLPKPNKNKEASIKDRWDVLTHLVKWGALLHDLGHVPLGHTLEDEFSGIYEKHDDFQSPRMPYLWDKMSDGTLSPIKEVFINEENKNLYPQSFQNLGISPNEVWSTVMLICLYKYVENDNEKIESISEFSKLYKESLRTVKNLFHQFMADIVADTICADYLDYIQRDTINVGLDTMKEDRILQSYFIGKDSLSNNFRMALSLVDRRGKPKLSICTAAKNMVRHRFDLAEIVYYHKTKVSASAMLAKVFSLIDKPQETGIAKPFIKLQDIQQISDKVFQGDLTVEDLKRKSMPDSLLHPLIGDETLLYWMEEKAWEKVISAKKSEDKKGLENALLAISLLEGIVERRLYKAAISINPKLAGKLIGTDQKTSQEDAVSEIIKKYRGDNKNNNNSQIERTKLESLICKETGWPDGTFLLYIPGRKSQAKGIETGALDDHGKVITLGKHDAVSDEVELLNKSYRGLWQFLVFVHPSYYKDNINLSVATDILLRELFPSIQLRHTSPFIKEVCRFEYIPGHYREAAILYSEVKSKNHLEPNWKNFNLTKGTVNQTLPEEYADRALLVDELYNKLPNEKPEKINELVKSKFSRSGSLKDEIENESKLVTNTYSNKGIIEKEEIKMNLISIIAKRLINNNGRNQKLL